MNNVCSNKDAYNKYSNLQNISYSIIQHLMQDKNCELLWKLLKYNEVDAWQEDDLTLDEKGALVYNGSPDIEPYSVFMDEARGDVTYDQKTYLFISPQYITPTNRSTGIVSITFQVLPYEKINHLSNYTTRSLSIIQQILEALNGEWVDGVGQLFFDSSQSRYDSLKSISFAPYKGYSLTMSVQQV